MDFNIVKTWPYISIAIAVIPALVSIVVFIDARYTYETTFEKFRNETTRGMLDNKRLILESKIYFLELCKLNPTCPSKNSAESEISVSTRELEATKETLDTFNNKIMGR